MPTFSTVIRKIVGKKNQKASQQLNHKRQAQALVRDDQYANAYLAMQNDQRSVLGLRPLEYVYQSIERSGILDRSTGKRRPLRRDETLCYEWVVGNAKTRASIEARVIDYAKEVRDQVLAQANQVLSHVGIRNTGADHAMHDVGENEAEPGHEDTMDAVRSDDAKLVAEMGKIAMQTKRSRQRRQQKEEKRIEKTKDNTGWDELEAGSDDIDEDEMEDSRP